MKSQRTAFDYHNRYRKFMSVKYDERCCEFNGFDRGTKKGSIIYLQQCKHVRKAWLMNP